MPTNPAHETKVFPLRAAARLAALLALATLAAPASATVLEGSSSVEVNIVEREGYLQGVHALVFLRSRYLVPMEGEVTLTVNGVVRKVEPVATDSGTVIDIFLGPMNGPITACATFGGSFWLGGDNYRSTQASGCDHHGVVPPSGLRAPARVKPGLSIDEFRPRR